MAPKCCVQTTVLYKGLFVSTTLWCSWASSVSRKAAWLGALLPDFQGARACHFSATLEGGGPGSSSLNHWPLLAKE